MNIEIDQSGKIENTSKNTIIALSNDISKGLLIKTKDKRQIQEIFRGIGKPRMFIYKLFTVLIFLLIKKDLRKIDQIIIDEEYPGKFSLIKKLLLQEIWKKRPDFPSENIIFQRIDKKAKVHDLAYNIFKEKKETMINKREEVSHPGYPNLLIS